MDIKQIKPYTFWIVCGVILIAELVYFGFMLKPTPPEADPAARGLQVPQTATASKRVLETKLRDLDQLLQRANKTRSEPPQTQVVDPANAAVLREYIVSKDWETPLRREVESRQAKVQAIRSELSNRSQSLHEPISSQTDPVAWYADYERVSAALVRHLIDEGVVAIPSGAGTGPLGSEFYRTNRDVRGILGLVTADGNQQQFSDANRRRQVSFEFRVIDALTRKLAEVRKTPEPHPVGEGFEELRAPTEQKVTIRALTVRPAPSGDGPRAYQVRLELAGSPAVLLAASRVVDGFTDPIMVRLGTKWERRSFGTREKHNVADVPMHWNADLLLLDFHDPALAAN